MGALKGIFGITGTPGTGKKSVAPLVAGVLGVRCFSVNELATARRRADADEGVYDVDTERLRGEIPSLVPRASVLYGHLLPAVLDPAIAERVVVLRCEPKVLRERLRSRGYPEAKVRANLEAELIGVVAAEAHEAFGVAACELDTTSTSPQEAAAMAAGLQGGAAGGRRIDWTLGYDSAPKLRSLLPPE
ncbi:MAG: AAA family ATPase [Nitrososphaerota archaeon]|nr:AAA family ATPase [Nitrososphaerota archaeon]